jgi:hypothetical protein
VKNNYDRGYVNGTRGTVVDFDEMGMPVVKTLSGEKIVVDRETWAVDDDDKVLASITQIPLRHAWAITVHKSQGMSLDEAVIDLSRAFGYGMGYVALSRVRKLDGLHLIGFSTSSLAVDPRILTVDKDLQNLSDRAALRLDELPRSDILDRQNAFITKCGGCLEAKPLSKKMRKDADRLSTQKTHEISYDLIKSGKSIANVAKERDLVPGTIIDHLAKAQELGLAIDFKHIKPKRADTKLIKEAFLATMDADTSIREAKLTPAKTYLDQAGETYGFDDLKLVRLFLK